VPVLRLEEIARATGGSILRGDPRTELTSFSIDTRHLGAGGLFFALAGTRADGHDFLGQATRAGAAAAVISRDLPSEVEAPAGLVRVPDGVEALGRCGSLARERLAGVKVIAVTGSTGKTMTKELLAAGLAAGHRVHRNPGNLNNHLGVPLSLLACPADAEFAVLELGMSAAGEIAALSKMTRPDVALVTNVRAVHLQFFEDLDGIAAAKGELFATLSPNSVAVVNLDDEHVRLQAARHEGPQLTFGSNPRADVRLTSLRDRFVPGAGLGFATEGRERSVDLRLGGAHSARNALAAVAGLLAAGGDVDAALDAMSRIEAVPGRGRVHHLGDRILLVDDTYNSNPAAMASVLTTLGATETAGRRVLVMGDMLELGRDEAALHREVGRLAAGAGVRLMFAVGPLAQLAGEAARRAGVPEIHNHADAGGAAGELPSCLLPGDVVLVKGSRSLRLERVVEAVLRARAGAS